MADGVKKSMPMFYALWNVKSGEEAVVCGYEATMRYQQPPWKKRSFASASAARDFLDGRKKSKLEDENKELRLRIGDLESELARYRIALKDREAELDEAKKKLGVRKKRHYNRKPIMVGDVYYRSTDEAAKALEIPRSTLYSRLTANGTRHGLPLDGGATVRYATPEETERYGGQENG